MTVNGSVEGRIRLGHRRLPYPCDLKFQQMVVLEYNYKFRPCPLNFPLGPGWPLPSPCEEQQVAGWMLQGFQGKVTELPCRKASTEVVM